MKSGETTVNPTPSDTLIGDDSLIARVRTRILALWSSDDVRTRTGRAAIMAFAIRVVSAGLLYLAQIAMARWMGSFEYGIYVFVWTWVLVLGGLAPAGLALSIIRLFPEHLSTGAMEKARGIVFWGRLFAFGASTLLAVFAGTVLYFASDLIAHHYVLPLYLALFCIPMYAVVEIHDGIGRGKSWMLEGLLGPYILRPIILLITIGAAFALGFATIAVTAAAAAIIATWVSGLIQLIQIEICLRRSLPEGPRAVDTPLWVATSLPLLAIGGCEMLLQYTDVLIVSRYVPPDQVGVYFAAAKTMALMLFVHYAVGSAAANRFAALSANGNRAELTEAVRDAVNWTFWPSLAAALVILVLGKPLLWLFGPSFTEGYPVMFILVLGFLARAATGPSDFLLNMSGEQARSAAVFGGAAVLNVVLNLALVPSFGLTGAAAATAMSLSAAAVAHAWLVRKRLGYRMWIGAR